MTTYDDLINYGPIATYAGNRDMITALPDLVRRAQSYVVQRLDHDLFADAETQTTVDTSGSLDMSNIPDRFLEIRALLIEGRGGRYFPLLPRAENMLETLYSDNKPGEPLYYARLKNDVIKVYPRPYREVAARYRSNVAPDVLSPTLQSNILTEKFPEVIETALLREIARFNLDATLVASYSEELADQLGAANAQVGRTTRDETVTRPKETRNVTGR